MRGLVAFIYESLKIKSDSNVVAKFNRAKFEKDCEEVLDTLVKEASEKPAIWDDSFKWDPMDEWDEYQDANGDWDDSLKVVKEQTQDTAVAVWTSEESYEDALKKAPEFIADIVSDKDAERHETLYKKGGFKVEQWECTREMIDSRILKFDVVRNDNGKEIPVYCWLIAIGV